MISDFKNSELDIIDIKQIPPSKQITNANDTTTNTISKITATLPLCKTQLKLVRSLNPESSVLFNQLQNKMNPLVKTKTVDIKSAVAPTDPSASLSNPMENSAQAHHKDDFMSVGTDVEGRYGFGSEWFPATIMHVTEPKAVSGAGDSVSHALYFLQYKDGDVEEGVRRLKIRLPNQRQRRELVPGEEVDALCESAGDGIVLGGRVTATPQTDSALEDLHYRITFDAPAAGSKSSPVVATLHRKFIFAAYVSTAAGGSTPLSNSVRSAASDEKGSVSSTAVTNVEDKVLRERITHCRSAAAYLYPIVPGKGRIFLSLCPQGVYLGGCG